MSLVRIVLTEPTYLHKVDQTNVHRLETLMRDRKVFLQHLAFETREKRLLLCSVLLEWGVNRELVLEICQSGEQSTTQKDRSDFETGLSSRSAASSVSGSSSLFHHERARVAAAQSRSRASNQNDEEEDDHAFESDDNQSELSILGLEQQQHQTSDHRKAQSTRLPQRVGLKHQQQPVDHHHHHRSVSASESHMAHIQTV